MILQSPQSYFAICIILLQDENFPSKDFDPPPTGPVVKANHAYSAIPFSLSGNKLESVYLSNTIDGFVTIFGALSCYTEKYCAKLLSNE